VLNASTTSSVKSPRNTKASKGGVQRRLTVWASFAAAMTAVAGILVIADAGAPNIEAAVSPTVVGHGANPNAIPLIVPREASEVAGRWQAIVIHHSGTPAGDAVTLGRQHVSAGLSGLGYHFVIGNGQGLGDGLVDVGYRWSQQLPGAHVASAPAGANGDPRRVGLSKSDAERYNRHAIGICLIGNGNRREFTDRQVNELVNLVRALQERHGIPASAVHLHSDLASVPSPGTHFPAARFESQIRR